MKEYLIFDLDGTLTDPQIGITTCVQYALKSFGIEEPDLDKLTPFIGPPLKDSFMTFYNMNEEQAEQAVVKYWERFSETGLFENEIYPGMSELLRLLKSRGMHLAIASSKPTVYVERILEHFRIKQYFEVIVGSELDGSRVKKDEVLREVLRSWFGVKRIETEKIYMIGDRKYDIEGAKKFNIESVGVAYGYGSVEELKEAHADYIVLDVKELQQFLFREIDEREHGKNIWFQMLWAFLYPVLLFVMVRQISANALGLVFYQLGQALSGTLANWLFVYDEAGELVAQTGNASAIMNALSYIISTALIWNMSIPRIKRAKGDMYVTHLRPENLKSYIALFAVTIGASMGINILLELMGTTNIVEEYQTLIQDGHSASLLVALLCVGVVVPIAEELLFRGIVFNVLKRRFQLLIAITGSALVYGIYTMNWLTGVYAFLIGFIAAYAYEYFGTFLMPVLVHIVSAILTYVISYTALVETGLYSWPVCILLFAVTALGGFLLAKDKRMF